MEIKTKRVYDPISPDDGCRILVDRLWPRGMTKDRLGADEWMKDVAPSNELRKWFKHEQPKWAEFRRRYFSELDENPEAIKRLRLVAKKGPVTLLYAARNTEQNHALALKEFLARQSK